MLTARSFQTSRVRSSSYVSLMALIALSLFQRLKRVSDTSSMAAHRESDSLLDRDVVANTAKLALESDTRSVVRTRSDRVDRRAALWVRVLLESATAVVYQHM